MNLDKFLNLLATMFGAFGSIYVMLAVLAASPELMEQQARQTWGFNGAQLEALAGQKGDNVAGFVFVIVAFVLATVTLAFVPEGVRLFPRKGVALAVAATLAGGLYVSLTSLSRWVGRQQKVAIGKIITLRALDNIIERRKLDTWNEPALHVLAGLVDLDVRPGEPARSLMARIAAKAGKVLPSDLDYSAVEPQKVGSL